MALDKIKTTLEPHPVVSTYDPDVTPNDPEDVGWIPADAATIKDGADLVLVRALNLAEDAEIRDAGGFFARYLAAAQKGVIGYNGKEKAAKARAWLRGVRDRTQITLLGIYVDAITNGEDPQARQRLITSIEPSPEGESEDEAAEAE